MLFSAGDNAECLSPRDGAGLGIDGLSDVADNESQQDERQSSSGGGETAAVAGQGIALVVDKEVTSYLMMGALSPGLKRHAVTLFEGEFSREKPSPKQRRPPDMHTNIFTICLQIGYTTSRKLYGLPW